jgi:hypothetical protein
LERFSKTRKLDRINSYRLARSFQCRENRIAKRPKLGPTVPIEHRERIIPDMFKARQLRAAPFTGSLHLPMKFMTHAAFNYHCPGMRRIYYGTKSQCGSVGGIEPLSVSSTCGSHRGRVDESHAVSIRLLI